MTIRAPAADGAGPAVGEGRKSSDARRRLAIASNGPFNSLATRLIVAWCHEGEGNTDAALAELKLIEQVGAFDLFRLFTPRSFSTMQAAPKTPAASSRR